MIKMIKAENEKEFGKILSKVIASMFTTEKEFIENRKIIKKEITEEHLKEVREKLHGKKNDR